MQSLSESVCKAIAKLCGQYTTIQCRLLIYGYIEYINKFGMKTLHIICACFIALLHEQSLSLPSGMWCHVEW